MESILFIALSFIKEFVYYIILCSLAFLVGIIILSIIVSIIRRQKVNLKRYNLIFIISLIAYLNGITIEIFMFKRVFVSFIDLLIGVSAFVIVGLIGNVILSLIQFKSKSLQGSTTKISIPKIDSEKTIEVLSCVENPVSVYSGYIDVVYLKGLIDKIKEKELEYDDEREVEELEIYLLNFVNRQPNAYERKKLSSFIEGFIKKLAKYNVI